MPRTEGCANASGRVHERLADWSAANTRDLSGKYEEIVGYHLEMAHRSLLELGPPNDRTSALAGRAAQTLSSAGERALARSDMPAAVNLLSRAIALLRPRDTRRLELLTEIAYALIDTGDFDRLVTVPANSPTLPTEHGTLVCRPMRASSGSGSGSSRTPRAGPTTPRGKRQVRSPRSANSETTPALRGHGRCSA